LHIKTEQIYQNIIKNWVETYLIKVNLMKVVLSFNNAKESRLKLIKKFFLLILFLNFRLFARWKGVY
jgi:hypothetical protein